MMPADRAGVKTGAAGQTRLDAMSPMECLMDIRAPLVVLAHDVDDAVIPIEESRGLVTAFSARAGVRFTELTMFKHLYPTKVHLPPVELAAFVRSVYPIFRQAA